MWLAYRKTMNTANKKQEKHSENVPFDTFDEFKYDEVSLEDELSLTEGEEDLDATVKAIKDRAEASARADQRSSAKANTHPPPTVAHFLRHYLWEMGMTETLECFQTEWAEIVQKGQVDEERVDVVPDVYTKIQLLDRELKNARREREEYRQTASVAAKTLLQVKRNRDIHRMKHQRVVQEKNRVIEDIRKLKQQCEMQEPELKRMNEKYQTVLKQVMLLALETDKLLLEADSQSAQQGTSFMGVRETAQPVTQPPAHPEQLVKESKCSSK